MRVMLLYPNLHGMNMLPSAIALFASILKNHGHEVDLFDSTNWLIPGEEDFNSDKEKEKNLNVRPFDDSILNSELRQSDVYSDFRTQVERFQPGLIMASVSEDIFPIGIRMLKEIRDFRIPTIMGGVFPTFAPDVCLSFEEVDMVCVGEGEEAIVDLVACMERGLPIDSIKNIWVKDNNSIRRNPLRPPTDINLNPLLDLSLFDHSRLYRPMQGKVWKMLPVETHRGCPYKCSYCNSPAQSNLYKKETACNHFRSKSIPILYKELQFYKNDIGAEAFYFWADTFLACSNKYFEEFIEMYSEIRLPFWCQAFPELIREDRIKRLMDVGLFRLGAGIEHGNESFRRDVLNRKVSNTTMVERFKILNQCGLPFSVNNIMGFPTETRQLAMDTVELNRLVDADSHNAYSFVPYHGTSLRSLSEKLGYIDKHLIGRSATKPTLLNMPQFKPAEVEGLRRCFILYVKMPKDRWMDIEKAEALTPEGDKIWSELRDECAEKYMVFND